MQDCSLRTLEIANEWSYCLKLVVGGDSGGRADALPQTFRWRDGATYRCSTKFLKYLIKYKLKCLQCFPLFVLAPCCVYNSKFTIIITLEVACYFVSICSDIEST